MKQGVLSVISLYSNAITILSTRFSTTHPRASAEPAFCNIPCDTLGAILGSKVFDPDRAKGFRGISSYETARVPAHSLTPRALSAAEQVSVGLGMRAMRILGRLLCRGRWTSALVTATRLKWLDWVTQLGVEMTPWQRETISSHGLSFCRSVH